MKLWHADKKEDKIKDDLLREVYEANLRISGQKTAHNHRRRKKRNILVLSMVFLLAIIISYTFFNYFALRPHPPLQAIESPLLKPANANRTAVPDSNQAVNPFPSPGYASFLKELPIPLRKVFGLKVKTILIDPGHGGYYQGTIGKSGLKEKDIALDIAKRLRKRLKKHGKYEILMTREEDVTLSLDDRIAFANSSKADLFISLHLNYFPNKPVNIIETFYFGPHTDNEDLLLAEKENKDTGYTLKDFTEIIGNIKNTLKTQESHSLAFFIQKSLYRNISRQNKESRNRGIKTAPFIVLLGVEVPSVLTEVTCLSNIDEEEKLTKADYREKIAGYLEEGIVNYLNKNPE